MLHEIVVDPGIGGKEFHDFYILERYSPPYILRCWGWKSFSGRRRVDEKLSEVVNESKYFLCEELNELVDYWYDCNGFLWEDETSEELSNFIGFCHLLVSCDLRRPDMICYYESIANRFLREKHKDYYDADNETFNDIDIEERIKESVNDNNDYFLKHDFRLIKMPVEVIYFFAFCVWLFLFLKLSKG